MIAARVRERAGRAAPRRVGVACFPLDGVDREELYQQADASLYAVKHGRAPGRAGRRAS